MDRKLYVDDAVMHRLVLFSGYLAVKIDHVKTQNDNK